MRTHRFAILRLPGEIAKEAFKPSRTIREGAREKTDLSEEKLDEVLDDQ